MANRVLFLYPDDYDATTATRRVLEAGRGLFPELKFLYWARNGVPKETKDPFYDRIEKEVFLKVAPPRSIQVVWITLLYQWWLLKKIRAYKPDFISAFYFYTAMPALAYKYLFNRSCKVVYDPRDYFAVCYIIHPAITWILRLIDNIFIRLADRVVFPDRQFFTYYGMFRMQADKYFILPNSTEDCYAKISTDDIYESYSIPKGSIIIPLIGYFSETRGKDLFFKIIDQQPEGVHFIVAGVIRDKDDETFFKSHSNVTFLDKIPYTQALWIMRRSTFVPLLYDPASLNNKYAIPTKFYDSLMVGTPVMVSFEQTDLYELVHKHHLGYGIAYNDVNQFIEKLMIFRECKHNFNADVLREHFLKTYDFSLFKQGLYDFYKCLIQ
jgi:hypothetical protein